MLLRGTFNYPDLDVLDSPLISPNPLSSMSGIPGSAIAEKIFNDPDSWEETDGGDGDYPEDVDGPDPLAWLVEEIERFKAQSAGVESNGAFDRDAQDKNKASLIATPASAVPQSIRDSLRRDVGAGWKGIGRRTSVRPISLAALFERSGEGDFSNEIQTQLSKILDSGGIPHHIRPLPSAALSPPSTTASNSTIDSPLQIQTASTSASSGENSPSPVAIYSASATLSFLEWYGIYPDSPRLDLNGRRSILQHQKSIRPKTPLLQVPSPRHAMRPSSLLSPPVSTETFTLPPPKRNSSVPPPGLDPPAPAPAQEVAKLRPASPPGLTRSPSPYLDRTQPQQSGARDQTHSRTDSRSSDRSLDVPSAAPPPYSRTPSPPGSRSRTGTPVRGTTVADASSSTTPIRRLPSIPPELNFRPITPPQVPGQPPALVRGPSRHASPSPALTPTPPPPSSSAGSASVLAFTVQQQQCGNARPVSVRSPLGGPAGPRTRASQSRVSSQETRGSAMGHRPPGLRL
ncbi:hypothetical protein B0H34DRAFT_724540 [Crassisporium funariophilum]|nr:hypothetical protein B0H34DRAFT_724540 [Crassisporium funariophilum]